MVVLCGRCARRWFAAMVFVVGKSRDGGWRRVEAEGAVDFVVLTRIKAVESPVKVIPADGWFAWGSGEEEENCCSFPFHFSFYRESEWCELREWTVKTERESVLSFLFIFLSYRWKKRELLVEKGYMSYLFIFISPCELSARGRSYWRKRDLFWSFFIPSFLILCTYCYLIGWN